MRTFLVSFIMVLILLVSYHGYNANAQGIPLKINYQGRVEVNGVPFDGMGQFKFALTNLAGDTYYWTNDGSTPTPPAAPTAAVSKNVSSGQYSIELGDTTLTNMTAVPVTVFNTPGVFLRIWFNDGSTGEQLLAPDKQLTSVPFAYMAQGVPDGAIGGAQIADRSITPNHVGRNKDIVSYSVTQNGSESGTELLTTVPANTNFVITDIVVEVVVPLNYNASHGSYKVFKEINGIQTVLTQGYYTPYDQVQGGPVNEPLHLKLEAGLPVESGAQVRYDYVAFGQVSNGMQCTVSGYLSATTESLFSGFLTASNISTNPWELYNPVFFDIVTVPSDKNLVLTDVIVQGHNSQSRIAYCYVGYRNATGFSPLLATGWIEQERYGMRPKTIGFRSGLVIPGGTKLQVSVATVTGTGYWTFSGYYIDN